MRSVGRLAVLIAGVIVTLVLLPLTVNVATGGVLAPATSWTWPVLGVLLLAATALGVHGLRRGDGISARFPDHPKNRPNALGRVERFARERLENSLAEKTRIALSLTGQPVKVVQQSRFRVCALGEPSREHFGSVHEAFEALDESMLVLGAPGSGKTTMLLELTTKLVELARDDERQPVPVLVDLAGWSRRKRSQSFASWVLAEVEHQYRIPHQVAGAWLAHGRLALVLDGLDEVEPVDRDSCVQALNELQDELLVQQLVVSSRERDYDRLATRLRMHGAVVISPLNRTQVLDFLESYEIDVDHELLDVLSSPLMLNIVMLGRRSGVQAGLDRRALFDAYVVEVLSSRRGQESLPPLRVLRWLKFLAAHTKGTITPWHYPVPDVPPRDVQTAVKLWLVPFARAGAAVIAMTIFAWHMSWTALVVLVLGFLLAPLLGRELLIGDRSRFRPVPVTGRWWWAASGLLIGMAFGVAGLVLVHVFAEFAVDLPSPFLVVTFALATGAIIAGWHGLTQGDHEWTRATLKWGVLAAAFAGALITVLGTPEQVFAGWQIGLALGTALSLVHSLDVRGDPSGADQIGPGDQRSPFRANVVALVVGAGIPTAWALTTENSWWTLQWPTMIGFGIGLLYGHIARWFWLTRWLHRLPVLAVAVTVCGHAPLRAQRFLRFAADRSLLVEAAGEFRFVHALVQEHLAGCDPEELTGRIR